MHIFWENLKFLVKSANTTQYWIAQQAGVSYHTLSGWMTKKRLPDAEQAYAIAQALGVTVEYLVDGDSGDDYVRKTLGIPEISEEKRTLIQQIDKLPEADIYILSATVAAMVEKTKQVKKIG